MKYIGLQHQIWRNNTKSIILLILFPTVLYTLVFAFFLILDGFNETETDPVHGFFEAFPWITMGVLLWFLIAYFGHSSMIRRATGAAPLERKSHKRVYNLVENLSMAAGMNMPKVHIIEDNSLNAFASGIDQKSYAVTLSRGIINKLDDEELGAVIAHELTHIKNRDVRLLIVSIIFVGIFSFLTEALLRSLRYSGGGSRGKKSGGAAIVLIIALAAIGWLLTSLFRFALSRKREYLADAGAVELTKDSRAMISALKKISVDSRIEAVKRKDVAQMFIDNPGEKKKISVSSMFATHPPISERIEALRAI